MVDDDREKFMRDLPFPAECARKCQDDDREEQNAESQKGTPDSKVRLIYLDSAIFLPAMTEVQC